MNHSPHELPGEPPAEPLHHALHAAVASSAAAHAARGYRVPEGAVRARARRRRAVRIAATGSLTLSLLVAAGFAAASFEPPDPTPPAFSLLPPEPTTEPGSLGAHAACGLSEYGDEEGSEFIAPVAPGNLWVTLRVEDPPLELTVPVGGAIDLTVVLQNRGNPAGDAVQVTNTEGPVFLALDDFGVVVGYARLDGPVNPVVLGPADSDTWSGFGPLLACPGKSAADGFLVAGQYGSMIVQSFDEDASPPFDALLTLGDLVVGSADGEPSPRAGECRSSLDALTERSMAGLSFEEPGSVLVTRGESFDPKATLHNFGQDDVEGAVQGGPLLLVLDSNQLVIARAGSLDPVPARALGADESLIFGLFEPLLDCVTGAPLAAGAYDFRLARLVTDPESQHAVDLLSHWGRLAVTEEAGATRTAVELPELPACGETIDGIALDPAFLRGALTFEGFARWSDEERGWVEDSDGRPVVEYEFTYSGPERELTFLDENVVLARDGRVVAVEDTGGWGGAQPETWSDGDLRTAAFSIFHACAGETIADYEPEGRYTLLGFTAAEYEDEYGLYNLVVSTLGPVEVDFGSR